MDIFFMSAKINDFYYTPKFPTSTQNLSFEKKKFTKIFLCTERNPMKPFIP